MEIIATIKHVQTAVSGTSQAGNAYKRQTIVIEYGDRYPKELALTLMNDKVDQYGAYLAPGQHLKFYFDASSREYNGRYYTECIIWKIESLTQKPQPSQPQQVYYQQPQQVAQPVQTVMPQSAPVYPQQIPNYAPAPTDSEVLPF